MGTDARMTGRPIIVWFRDDLRLSDHPALHAAAKTGAPVIGLYVLDEESRTPEARPLGGAARWWLAQSLRSLQADLRSAGASLVLRKGAAANIIAEVAREADAQAVFWNEIAQAPHLAVAGQVGAALADIGVSCARVLRVTSWWPQPMSVTRRTGACGCSRRSGGGCRRWVIRQSPCRRRRGLPASHSLASDTARELATGARKPGLGRWPARDLEPRRGFGAGTAQDLPRRDAAGYSSERDRPDRDGTSKLSPHLRFGEISPRQIWHAARFAAAEHPSLSADIDKFLSELGWREFCRHLLFDVPDLAGRNLQPSFDAFPWKPDNKALARLAARPDRLPHRRCRHARTLAQRRDA